jgi:hypothetical protein
MPTQRDAMQDSLNSFTSSEGVKKGQPGAKGTITRGHKTEEQNSGLLA